MVNINWSTINTAQGVLEIANTQTGSWFWTATLFMMWGVLIISMLTFGFPSAIMGASFGAFMIGVILTYMGLVSWLWTSFFMGIIILIIFYKIMSSNSKFYKVFHHKTIGNFLYSSLHTHIIPFMLYMDERRL